MNQDLSQIVVYYATKPHKELSELLLSKSKDNLIAILTDLLTAYINDKNSSSLREYVTVLIAEYQHNPNKLGYNGYKQSSAIGGKSISCEAKPKNIQTDGYELKKTKSKLNGEGGFKDIEFVKNLGKQLNYRGFHSLNFFQISNTIFSVAITLFLPILALLRFPSDSTIKR